MLNLKLNAGIPLNILFLGAHSDDIEIGCGGTLLYLKQKYNIGHVSWIVFSASELRAKEATKSANLFLDGIDSKNIEIKNFRDGFFPHQFAEIKEFFEKMKLDIPFDLVFTHYRIDRHQDHRTLSDLTWNTFRNHLVLEYEIPKYDGDMGSPNVFVPLDEKLVAQKNEIILKSFTSQANKHWFDSESFNALLRLRGMEAAVKYAEGFYGRKVVL